MYSPWAQEKPGFGRKDGEAERSLLCMSQCLGPPPCGLLSASRMGCTHCSATVHCSLAIQDSDRLSSADSQCLKVRFQLLSPMVPCKVCSQKGAPGNKRYIRHPSTPLHLDEMIHTAFLLG